MAGGNVSLFYLEIINVEFKINLNPLRLAIAVLIVAAIAMTGFVAFLVSYELFNAFGPSALIYIIGFLAGVTVAYRILPADDF